MRVRPGHPCAPARLLAGADCGACVPLTSPSAAGDFAGPGAPPLVAWPADLEPDAYVGRVGVIARWRRAATNRGERWQGAGLEAAGVTLALVRTSAAVADCRRPTRRKART